MINTLIVDDEALLRKGLIALIDWTALGFRVVGEAANGQEAEEFIENNPIDLVISDIRMPVVSGIDLMRSVRERKKDVKFIILSGYDDFHYAQSALKYGAVSYVLKPFEEEEMVAELIKVKADMEQSARDENERKELEAAALDAFLSMLLNNKVDQKLFDANISRLSIDFHSREYLVIVLKINLKDMKNMPPTNTFIQTLVSEFQSDYQGEVLIQTSQYNKKYEIVYLLNGRASIDSAEKLLQLLRDRLDRYENMKYNIGVGLEVSGFEKVPQSYHNAREALDYMLSYGNQSVIFYENSRKSKKSSAQYPLDLELAIFETLRLKSSQKLEAAIDSFFAYLENAATSVKTIRQWIIQFVSSYKNQNSFLLNDLDISEIISFIADSDDVDDMKEYLAQILMSSLSEPDMSAEPSRKNKKLIDDVKEYVGSHYSERITLEDISNSFYISKSYFCRVFKECTGMNFYNYLNHCRIEKAKELLRNSYYKNYEICERIGFENSSYFNQLFKKVTGITPCEYRDAVIHNTVSRPSE